jgi:hypothetical protein
MGRLRDQMKADMELKGFSLKTQKGYVGYVRCFELYFNKSPEFLGEDEIKEYLFYLISESMLQCLEVSL